ncbi:hypothetical protein I6E74_12540 [Salinibacterium sp. SWN139]|nr:hypothetical protein [Salinibacterium sp. SWN139]
MHSVRRRRRLLLESLWFLGALGLALGVVTQLAGPAGRAELMFLDGDSMIVPLLSRSLLEGTASNWAMSAVLFVPETLVFLALAAVGLGIQQAQFVAAVLNFVGLYFVFRAAAVTVATDNRAALAATSGFVAVCALAVLESGGDANSPQLASLLATTTYYSATVLGALLSVGIARRIVGSSLPQYALVFALCAVATVSVFSNPLYLAWATAPLILVVVVTGSGAAWGRSQTRLIAALGAGSVLGYLLRIPLAPWIVANPDNYLKPGRSRGLFAYYWSIVSERLATPTGVLAVVVVLVLTLLGAWLTVRSLHRGAIGSAVVAAYSWFAPLVTTIGFILLGTDAVRYLQLWAFAPALALVVLVADARPPKLAAVPWRRLLALAALPAFLGGVLTAFALPAAVERATATDPSLQCAVDWVNESDAIGAGQFWSARAVKAHLNDPAQIIQTDFALHDYEWLVDRADFAPSAVSFLIVDDQSAPFTLPPAAENLPSTTVDCGRFQILDYSPASITRP